MTLNPRYLKGWKNFKITAVALTPGDLKHSGFVDREHVRVIDLNLFFFKLKLPIFRLYNCQ